MSKFSLKDQINRDIYRQEAKIACGTLVSQIYNLYSDLIRKLNNVIQHKKYKEFHTRVYKMQVKKDPSKFRYSQLTMYYLNSKD